MQQQSAQLQPGQTAGGARLVEEVHTQTGFKPRVRVEGGGSVAQRLTRTCWGKSPGGGARGMVGRETPDSVVVVVLVMLLLVLWRTAELARQPPDISHKTTAAWVARAEMEQVPCTREGLFQSKQRFLEECMRRLVERIPLTVWERTMVRGGSEEEAAVGGNGNGTLHARDREQLCERERPCKRRCARTPEGVGGCGDVGQLAVRSDEEGLLSEWLWRVRRPQLTVLHPALPAPLSAPQIVDVLGTALGQFVQAAKHAKKRATPVQAWATAVEATAAPAARAVLEAAWKWDGVGGQPVRGTDGPGFDALFLTYRACFTIATHPDVLAPWSGLPPGHKTLGELAQRFRAGMRLGYAPAVYGPIPSAPRPSAEHGAGASERWRLHALAEAVVYAAPHDGRLHCALRRELCGCFDRTHQILWAVEKWSTEGWTESVTIHTQSASDDVVLGGETGLGVSVEV